MNIIDKDLNDWLEKHKAMMDNNDRVSSETSASILALLKGVDRVSCLPTILANIFESIEHPCGDGEAHGFKNQIVDWGLEYYAGRKIYAAIPMLKILHEYCHYKGYDESNKWEWGVVDRTVCYVPVSDDKKVLLFENQNIEFVVVFDSYKIHVRRVYKSYDNDSSFYYKQDYFKGVDALREALKRDDGLEIAVSNLTGKYNHFCNTIGSFYPDKIDLNTMKLANFDKDCTSFRYGDNRDTGYIMSFSSYLLDRAEKCELNDINEADYALNDMTSACFEIPLDYLNMVKRDAKLKNILDKK